MINLEIEKSLHLSAQDRYDIISFAMEAADENGFINSFVFERALYCYTAIMLYPEHKDLISQAVAENLIKAWETLIENGFIEQMTKDYETELSIITQEAQSWYEEYSDWAHSARGILDTVQTFSGNIVQNAATMLKNTAQETGVEDILEVAEDWGMTRNLAAPHTNEVIEKAVEESSLFSE